eukprot:6700399-Alexandrium_andersonii.AAC.1
MNSPDCVHTPRSRSTRPPGAPLQLLALLSHHQLSALAHQVLCTTSLSCAECLEDVTLWITTISQWLDSEFSLDLVAMVLRALPTVGRPAPVAHPEVFDLAAGSDTEDTQAPALAPPSEPHVAP